MKKIFHLLFAICFLLSQTGLVLAQNSNGSVELNGDTVEYSVDGNLVIARGNVVIIHGETIMECDYLEFSRDTHLAKAEGNVRLKSPQGEITGNEITFNFKTMTGDIYGARIYSYPYYGSARKISRVSDDKIELTDGYVTTSDYDKPEYRITSKKIDIYPGEKLIARNSWVVLGEMRTAYVPWFRQRLDDKKPLFTITPGHDKKWGTFALTNWRYYINEGLQGVVHLDYRNRLGFASGVDVKYKSEDFGDGIMKLYYTGERDQEQKPQVQTIERFKGEWRHKWDIDDNTSAIWQYYRLSDSTFLKDYFETEHDNDPNPDTFFLLTRTLPLGTISARTDVRVNRFESKVERLPEVRYDLGNAELWDSGLYFKNTTIFSNLTRKTPSPSEARLNTMRLDTVNELSYPMKLGFVELNPFVGGRNTYYSKTKDPEKYDSIRGIFSVGASMSTKFYKMMDIETNFFGIEINQLRHIITPTIAYRRDSEPTLSTSQIDQFDGIDSQARSHTINFAIENKLQTKRDGQSVDLLRAIVSTDYHLKEDPGIKGFNFLKTDVDFKPAEWLTFYFDSEYDMRQGRLDTANFDVYINNGEKWSFGIGKRFNADVDDQITTSFYYKFNQKWAFRAYERIDLDEGKLKEQQYSLIRDLHTWEMEAHLNDSVGDGTEILLLFRLKAFPEIGFDFGTSFDDRESGKR